MKYVASFPYCYQSGPDDWTTEINTMVCDENTTLAQIHEWKRKRTKFKDVEITVTITQDSAQ